MNVIFHIDGIEHQMIKHLPCRLNLGDWVMIEDFVTPQEEARFKPHEIEWLYGDGGLAEVKSVFFGRDSNGNTYQRVSFDGIT